MAKCSVHGSEIGTVHFLTRSKRYMSDGVILVNRGDGWKLYGKVKAGVTPRTAFANAQARLEQALKDHPLNAAYRKALHETCGMDKRARLHLAITMMPEDADGVWSECCDGYGDNVHADLDEIAELCRLWLIASKEPRTQSFTTEPVAA